MIDRCAARIRTRARQAEIIVPLYCTRHCLNWTAVFTKHCRIIYYIISSYLIADTPNTIQLLCILFKLLQPPAGDRQEGIMDWTLPISLVRQGSTVRCSSLLTSATRHLLPEHKVDDDDTVDSGREHFRCQMTVNVGDRELFNNRTIGGRVVGPESRELARVDLCAFLNATADTVNQFVIDVLCNISNSGTGKRSEAASTASLRVDRNSFDCGYATRGYCFHRYTINRTDFLIEDGLSLNH